MQDNEFSQRLRVLVFDQEPSATEKLDLRQLGKDFSQASITHLRSDDFAAMVSPRGDASINWLEAVHWLRQRQFAAAVILTIPGQSPYTLGYLCYLAGIPIRIGRSQEFGGQVLTHCLPPET